MKIKLRPYPFGISLTVLFSIVFIILKLCKIINWSWIWVISPLWISVAITILAIFIALIYCLTHGLE